MDMCKLKSIITQKKKILLIEVNTGWIILDGWLSYTKETSVKGNPCYFTTLMLVKFMFRVWGFTSSSNVNDFISSLSLSSQDDVIV